MSRTLSGLISGDTDLNVTVSLAHVPASILTSGKVSVDHIPLNIPKTNISSAGTFAVTDLPTNIPLSKTTADHDLNLGTHGLTANVVTCANVVASTNVNCLNVTTTSMDVTGATLVNGLSSSSDVTVNGNLSNKGTLTVKDNNDAAKLTVDPNSGHVTAPTLTFTTGNLHTPHIVLGTSGLSASGTISYISRSCAPQKGETRTLGIIS
jgi:hypothetical protein